VLRAPLRRRAHSDREVVTVGVADILRVREEVRVLCAQVGDDEPTGFQVWLDARAAAVACVKVGLKDVVADELEQADAGLERLR
jgi:hypothetical protein